MISPYKILIIWSSYELGGAERQLIRLADDWQENGYQVEFLGMFDGSLRKKLEAKGHKTHLLGGMHEPTFIWRVWRKLGLLEIYYEQTLEKELRKIRPDIVVSAMNFCNVLTGQVWQKIPSIKGHIWNQVDLGLGRMDQKLEEKAVKNASYLVANSRAGGKFLTSEFNKIKGLRKKIKVIPNIVEIKSDENEIQNVENQKSTNRKIAKSEKKLAKSEKNEKKWRYRREKSEIIVAMVANLSQYKDYRTLLIAWSEVLKKKAKIEQNRGGAIFSAPWRLLIAGRDDGEKADLEVLAEELGLKKGEIEFLGRVEKVEELLAETDIAVLASQSEGSSNSLAEYMLSGLAVVAGKIAANIELLGENYAGYYQTALARENLSEVKKWQLSMGASRQQQIGSGEMSFTAGRSGDLAKKIWELISYEELRKDLGDANRHCAQKIFSNDANLAHYRQLIEKIL